MLVMMVMAMIAVTMVEEMVLEAQQAQVVSRLAVLELGVTTHPAWMKTGGL